MRNLIELRFAGLLIRINHVLTFTGGHFHRFNFSFEITAVDRILSALE